METSKHDIDDAPPSATKVTLPAEARINALESDAVHHEIEVIREPSKIQPTLLDLIATAREEVLFLFPTSNAFHREEGIGAIDSLVAADLASVHQVESRKEIAPNRRTIPTRFFRFVPSHERRMRPAGFGPAVRGLGSPCHNH